MEVGTAVVFIVKVESVCVDDLKALHWTTVFSEKQHITSSLRPAQGQLPNPAEEPTLCITHISNKPRSSRVPKEGHAPKEALARAASSALVRVLLSVFPRGRLVSPCLGFFSFRFSSFASIF